MVEVVVVVVSVCSCVVSVCVMLCCVVLCVVLCVVSCVVLHFTGEREQGMKKTSHALVVKTVALEKMIGLVAHFDGLRAKGRDLWDGWEHLRSIVGGVRVCVCVGVCVRV